MPPRLLQRCCCGWASPQPRSGQTGTSRTLDAMDLTRKGAFGRPFGSSLLRKDKVIAFGTNQNRFAFVERAFKNLFCQWIFQRALNGSTHRPRTVLWVVAFVDE